jgi:hypothetical protein
MLLLGLSRLAFLPAQAQTPGDTVQQDAFRSRWADYQVDRPEDSQTSEQTLSAPPEQTGLLSAFSRTFEDYFRNGPLQVRADLSTGWEFTNEADLIAQDPRGAHESPFIAPAIGLFYNRDFGIATVSARYSAGYVYYLDHSYIAAGQDGGIFSETAGLDVKVEGSRTAFTSSGGASYGNGEDIQSGEQRTVFNISETVEASYVLTPFTQVGTTAGITYANYSGGTVPATNLLTDNDTIYLSYAYTPKTSARLELSAGQQFQSANAATSIVGIDSGDRYYYQALVLADYVPNTKLTMSAGVGYGFQSESSVLGAGSGGGGSHPVYRLTIRYEPTEKTTGSLVFGYEGVDVEPSLQLQVAWQFRLNTSANLSVYQENSFSDYEVGENLTTRGALASVRQRLFGRVDLTFSTGVEQSEGYTQLAGQAPASEKPYYFGGVSVLWELNSYLAVQAYYRAFTGESGAVTNQGGLQSSASVSFRLTF